MFSTSVIATGYVVAAQVFSPKKCYDILDENNDWGKKHIISLDCPNHKQLVQEIECKIKTLRQQMEPDYRHIAAERTSGWTNYNTDTITDKKGYLSFETIHEPKFEGLSVVDDGQLLYEHITLLGHLAFHKGGNAYLSFHTIRAQPIPYSFELDDEDEDDAKVDYDF